VQYENALARYPSWKPRWKNGGLQKFNDYRRKGYSNNGDSDDNGEVLAVK